MVSLTNTLDTQNLKEHCNGTHNKHFGYTESPAHYTIAVPRRFCVSKVFVMCTIAVLLEILCIQRVC